MLEYNKPLEVSEEKYKIFKKSFSGLIAHRKDSNGKFWIKPLCFMGYKNLMEKILKL